MLLVGFHNQLIVAWIKGFNGDESPPQHFNHSQDNYQLFLGEFMLTPRGDNRQRTTEHDPHFKQDAKWLRRVNYQLVGAMTRVHLVGAPHLAP